MDNARKKSDLVGHLQVIDDDEDPKKKQARLGNLDTQE